MVNPFFKHPGFVCVYCGGVGKLLCTFEDILCHIAIVTQRHCSLLASMIRSLFF